MKRTFTTLVLVAILSLSYFNANAKVWRLNNNPGVSADFSTWQDAYNGANANDTIYIEGSPYNYGDIVFEKPLVIIGTGYFLNQNPNTQPPPYLASNISSCKFNPGSNGSILTGITIGTNTNGYIYVNCSDIKIIKNYFWRSVIINYLQSQCINNITIAQNIMGAVYQTANRTSENIVIKNNLIMGANIYGTYVSISLSDSTSALIYNNIIANSCYSFRCTFINNIFTNLIDIDTANNLFKNNLSNSNRLPSIYNNKSNVDMSSVFISGGTSDGHYQLKEGSPAIGAGINGEDCGMFGGNNPYVLSGMTNIPAIYHIMVPSTTYGNYNLHVTVKAIAH